MKPFATNVSLVLLVLYCYLELIQSTTYSTYQKVYVGVYTDSASVQCSGTSLGSSNCNIRSAWSSCISILQSYMYSGSCTSNQGIKCEVIVPAGSTTAMRPSQWGELSMSSLTSAATSAITCPMALAISSSSSSPMSAIIRGDNTANRFAYMAGNQYLRDALTFTITNIAISNFGLGLDIPDGGAMYITTLAGVAVQSCLFQSNAAMNGGAMYIGNINSGSGITVTASNFSSNTASYPTGGVWDATHYYDPADYETGDGGALYLASSTNILIFSSLFTKNVASDSGGAIYSYKCTDITFKQTIFTYNQALLGWGGAAIMYYYTNNVVLSNCTLAYQVLPGQFAYGGGAIGSYFGTKFSMDTTLMEKNRILQAGGSGAAMVFLKTTSITITTSIFRGNRALQNGGAITFYAGCDDTYIYKCLFSHNGLSTTQAGPADVAGGGAIMIETFTNFLAEDTRFEYNEAIFGGALTALYGASELAFKNCVFIGNSAHTNLVNNPYITDVSGGAVYISGCSLISFTGTSFINNTANRNGGACFFTSTPEVSFDHVNMTGNSALLSGGSIFFDKQSSVITLSQTMIANGVSGEHGGAVAFGFNTTSVSIRGSSFVGNKALDGYGGAIYFDDESSAISIGGYSPILETTPIAPHESTNPDIPGLIIYDILTFTPSQLAGLSGFYLLFAPTVTLATNCIGDGINFTSIVYGESMT